MFDPTLGPKEALIAPNRGKTGPLQTPETLPPAAESRPTAAEAAPVYQDQTDISVSARLSQAPEMQAFFQQEVRFRLEDMLELADADTAQAAELPASGMAEIDEWEFYGYRDTLLGPDVEFDAMQQELHQMLARPDAAAFVARLNDKLSQVLQEAEGQGYMVDQAQLGGDEFAWLFNVVDAKPAGSYDYLKAVQAMIEPMNQLLNHPADVKLRQERLIKFKANDSFELLPEMVRRGLIQSGEQNLLQMAELIQGDGANFRDTSVLSRMLENDLRATGGLNQAFNRETLSTPKAQAVDNARARIMAASSGHRPELAQLQAIFKKVNDGAGLDENESSLLQRFGLAYDSGSKTLSAPDDRGQPQAIDDRGLDLLRQDLGIVLEPHQSPAATAYLGRLREVMEKTGILERETQKLHQLMEEANRIRREQQQTQRVLSGTLELQQRLANGGTLRASDEALLKQLDPSLSLVQAPDGSLRVMRGEQEVASPELQQFLQQKRQQLVSDGQRQSADLNRVTSEIRNQEQVVRQARTDLQAATTAAEDAFGQLSPEEQERFGSLHASIMRQAETALAQADQVLARLDAFFAEIEAGMSPLMGEPTSDNSPDDATTDESSLAPAPQAGAQDSLTDSQASQQREEELRSEQSETRNQQLGEQVQHQAMSAFLDRIQLLRRELQQEADEDLLAMQQARSDALAQDQPPD